MTPKTGVGPKMKSDQNETLLELKHHLNRNFSKTEMSLKLSCHQNPNVTKTYSHHNLNLTQTQISP